MYYESPPYNTLHQATNKKVFFFLQEMMGQCHTNVMKFVRTQKVVKNSTTTRQGRLGNGRFMTVFKEVHI